MSVLPTIPLWEQELQHLMQSSAHQSYSIQQTLEQCGQLGVHAIEKSKYNLQLALCSHGSSISTDPTNHDCVGL